MKRTLLIVGIFGVLIVGLLAFPATVQLLTDWWWFTTIGFQQVFVKEITTKFLVGGAAGLIAVVFFYANLRFAQRGVVPDPVVVNFKTKQTRTIDITRGVRALALPVSLGMGVLVGLSASTSWMTVLEFLNQTPFGIRDPVFGRDVAYYVFGLPAAAGLVMYIQGITILSLFIVLPLYLLRGDLALLRNRLNVEPSAQRHVAVLVALLFFTAVLNTYLIRIPSLLYSTTGPFFGASYADLVARLPLMRASGALALLCGLWVLWGAKQLKVPKNVAVAVIAYVIFTAIIGNAFPGAIQKLIVVPNELVKETPQLEHHIAATRQAWGIDHVETRALSGEAELTLEDIQANQGTIKNVRLWDRDPLLQTFGQLQEIRTYYDFLSVDDDRYVINGEYRQVLLSPRELNTQLLPNRSFPNERLTFTHGMGLTLSPVNQITAEGLPVLFIKDLPPVSSVSIKVTRPEIYYGELASDWVFVNTAQPEFDFPSGDSSAFTSYAGLGGITSGGWWRKALFSARFQSLKIFLSDDIAGRSKLLMHRNIRERAERALPFLSWDSDPYIVITDDGELKWIVDAYTRSRRYPYSAAAFSDGTNYMRNSVKVIIDAYDGSVTAYLADPDDPIIRTYDRIFPGLLKPLDEMPADLRSHIRYPEDLFRAQTQLYTVYHMDAPDVFYHREDEWQIPSQTNARESTRDPFRRHMVMRLPGEAREEYVFMTPFTPREKENLAAWMVARNDGEFYGQLLVYRFPRQSLVFGPRQIVNRIDQDTDVSRQLSLWDQRGSEVIRGNLLVIPINEALLFVQAVYLRAEGGRIPELKRVIVAYKNRVVMEETLDRGIMRLFGGAPAPPIPELMTLPVGDELAATPTPEEARPALAATASIQQIAAEAADAYDRAIAAQRAGDWATYGREMQRVGELLRRLRDNSGPGTVNPN